MSLSIMRVGVVLLAAPVVVVVLQLLVLLLVQAHRQLLRGHEVIAHRLLDDLGGLRSVATYLLDGVLMLLQKVHLVPRVEILCLLHVVRVVAMIDVTLVYWLTRVECLLNLLAVEHRLRSAAATRGHFLGKLRRRVEMGSLLIVRQQVSVLLDRGALSG